MYPHNDPPGRICDRLLNLRSGGSVREIVIRAVEAYLKGLGSQDLSAAPFSPEIVFEGPLGPPINGAAALTEFLTSLFPAISGVHIVRHIVDGDWCATIFDLHTTFGVIPVIDSFRVVDGQILSIRAYYDPRPVIEGMNRAAKAG
jgi:hypothetical protein